MESREIMYYDVPVTVYEDGTIIIDGIIRKQTMTLDGYLRVSLKVNNRWTTAAVHRLVALAFIPNDNPNINVEVNHIDYDRTNNHYTNLEWTSHINNIKHSKDHYKHRYGSLNPNFGNHKLSKFYKEHPDISKQKQGRSGGANGKAVKINLYHNDKLVKTFDYIGECSEYLVEIGVFNCTVLSGKGIIYRSRKSKTPYKGYKFVEA